MGQAGSIEGLPLSYGKAAASVLRSGYFHSSVNTVRSRILCVIV